MIVFHPADSKGRRAIGMVRDGRYRLTTVEGHDGALPGTYKVSIESRGNGLVVVIPAQYTRPETTPLRCQVKASRNSIVFALSD
jgi:hypothetical protein